MRRSWRREKERVEADDLRVQRLLSTRVVFVSILLMLSSPQKSWSEPRSRGEEGRIRCSEKEGGLDVELRASRLLATAGKRGSREGCSLRCSSPGTREEHGDL